MSKNLAKYSLSIIKLDVRNSIMAQTCTSFLIVHFSASWLYHSNLRRLWPCRVMRMLAVLVYYFE